MALETILVPYDGGEEANAMLRLACNVISGKQRVLALYVTRVPMTLPLAPLPAWVDRDGNHALDRAVALAAQQGVAIESDLIRARSVVDAIVDVAQAQQADAIFMPAHSRHRPWHALMPPRSVRAVIRRAPCPVLVGDLFGPLGLPWLVPHRVRRVWLADLPLVSKSS